jgi:hypothetical protein
MPFITEWLKIVTIPAPAKSEAHRLDSQAVDSTKLKNDLRKELAEAYLDPWQFEDLFKTAGLDAVFDHLRSKHFPSDEKTRKGNFGETLALVWIRDALGYEVPLVKRRWAMNKDRSQHGEDVIGFVFDDKGVDKLLLIEAKFYLSHVPVAIKKAHDTITKCMTATECYSLHAIMSYFQAMGERARYDRVKKMFDNFSGAHFLKNGGIFLVTSSKTWKDNYFETNISSNELDGLKCWALVGKDMEGLYKEAHE